MRKVLLTDDELMSQLRLQGIRDLADVALCCMENDGRVSVVEREKDEKQGHQAPERQAS